MVNGFKVYRDGEEVTAEKLLPLLRHKIIFAHAQYIIFQNGDLGIVFNSYESNDVIVVLNKDYKVVWDK